MFSLRLLEASMTTESNRHIFGRHPDPHRTGNVFFQYCYAHSALTTQHKTWVGCTASLHKLITDTFFSQSLSTEWQIFLRTLILHKLKKVAATLNTDSAKQQIGVKMCRQVQQWVASGYITKPILVQLYRFKNLVQISMKNFSPK